jgi:glyoxylase I family protein
MQSSRISLIFATVGIDIQDSCPLLQVFDMPASLRFYRDLLGFEIVQRSRPDDNCGWAWLKRNEAALMLNTAYDDGQRPAAPDPERTASHDDTTLYFGCPDVDAAYQHLRSHGLDVDVPKVAPYGMKQLYVKDPDGYNLCFQWATAPDGRT